MAFDAKKDGFVTLDDLKSIIIHFTLPVSDQLFAQLMDRQVVTFYVTILLRDFLIMIGATVKANSPMVKALPSKTEASYPRNDIIYNAIGLSLAMSVLEPV